MNLYHLMFFFYSHDMNKEAQIDKELALFSPTPQSAQQVAKQLKKLCATSSLAFQQECLENSLELIKEHREKLQERVNLLQLVETGYSIRHTVSGHVKLFCTLNACHVRNS